MWTVEAWGEREGRVVVFWHWIPRPSLFFPPPPSCGFMAYLPVADFHLATSGDLWQICCRGFDKGLQEERDLQQGSCAGPDGPGGLASSGAI